MSKAKFGYAARVRVVLDSNILIADFHLSGPLFRQTLDGVQRLGATLIVPRLVADEVKNKYGERLREAARAAEKTAADLGRLLRREWGDSIDVEEEAARYADWLDKALKRLKASVPDYPKTAHETVVRRALERRKPFDADGRRGYRDALIWELLLQLAAAPGGELVFVSNNSNDFAEKGVLHPQLVEDLNQLKLPNIALVSGLEALTREFILPKLPSGEPIAQSWRPILEKWLDEGLEALLEEYPFEPREIDLPGAYDDLRLVAVTRRSESPPVVSTVASGELVLHLEISLVAEFNFSITREDLIDIRRRDRRNPSMRTDEEGSDQQPLRVSLALTINPTLNKVIESEITELVSEESTTS